MRVEERIMKAEEIYEKFGKVLLEDGEIRDLIKKLDSAIDRTKEYMRRIGVTEICRQCALETGSCCKRWVEDEHDVSILLINLLLGVELPKERYREDLCFFCGEKGCRIKAREVICVTFLCDRIRERIGLEKEIELQKIAGEELELCFVLQEKIKDKLRSLDYEPELGGGILKHLHDFSVYVPRRLIGSNG